ncbi:MAG TPA: HIRAN domain-containing protein [Solirubrobacteraceae bacterium]|nr:HIRAN domain-containing protein [Solirubrobacteraceae bacterium]
MEVQVVHEERYWYPDDGGQVWLAGYTPVADDGRFLARDAPELLARGLRVVSVAGVRHRPEAPAEPGQALELRRDPGNEHDANAIEVLAGGEVVGFVPRELAAELAPELDAGRPWSAAVLREQRPSPREPRTGLTMVLAPDTSVSFVTWRPMTSSRRTRRPSGSS